MSSTTRFIKSLRDHFGPKPNPPRDPIPTDILLAIVPHLAPAQLAICARVSQLFYHIVTPLLYRSIYINLDKDINAVFRRRVSPFARHRRVTQALAKLGREKERITVIDKMKEGEGLGIGAKSKFRFAKITVPLHHPLDLPIEPTSYHRFHFVTSLTITAHLRTLCETLRRPVMPSLVDLRIRPGLHQVHFDLCRCEHFREDEIMPGFNGRCTAAPPCICPLLSHLRPRRLLIGDDTTGLSGSGMGFDPTSPPFATHLREIVVFVGACTGCEFLDQAAHHWVESISSSVEKLTMVMQPREEVEGWMRMKNRHEFSRMLYVREGLWEFPNGRWRMMKDESRDERLYGPERLWRELGLAMIGKAGILEVVGLETVDRDWTKMSVKEAEEELRDSLRRWLVVGYDWAEEAAEARVQAIRFMDRKEFDARQ